MNLIKPKDHNRSIYVKSETLSRISPVSTFSQMSTYLSFLYDTYQLVFVKKVSIHNICSTFGN